jgi:hypothetical protein
MTFKVEVKSVLHIGIPVFFDNFGNFKEILSNSKRENDNFEAVSNDTYSDSVKSHEVEILNHCSRKFFELPFSSKIKVMVSPCSW